MGVGVGSIRVGQWSITVSITMAIETAVIQPRVGFWVSFSFWLSLSLSLLSLSFFNSWSSSRGSSNRNISKVVTLSTGNKSTFTVLTTGSRDCVDYWVVGIGQCWGQWKSTSSVNKAWVSLSLSLGIGSNC